MAEVQNPQLETQTTNEKPHGCNFKGLMGILARSALGGLGNLSPRSAAADERTRLSPEQIDY